MDNILYKNKYRIESARLKGYDYSQEGFYFVTICTHDREEFFGDVKNKKMVFNAVGKIVADEWLKTEKIRENIFMDEWIVMPNHLHGILIINNDIGAGGGCGAYGVETPRRGVSTVVKSARANNPMFAMQTPRTAGQDAKTAGGHKLEWKSGSLGAIINQFKGQCTKIIKRSINPNFAWQTRYYDRIIRNEKSLNNIRQYIIENPAKWEWDRNNSENVWM